MAYNFNTQYRFTFAHGNADALSRFPVGTDPALDRKEEACHTVIVHQMNFYLFIIFINF